MDHDSDSDVKIVTESSGELAAHGKGGTDSDVRLEGSGVRKGKPEDSFLTDEIDLDAELRKAEDSREHKAKPSFKTPPPGPSPFELSEPGMSTPKPAARESKPESSEFELSLDSGDDLDISSSELEALKGGDDEVKLGAKPAKGAGDSGINLQEPADSGISLEKDKSDEIDFELSLDAETTPKPAKAKPQVDSSSEFELTLEDSASLAPIDSDEKAADKDIFETDFEVPALEDESGSQVAALDESDTDLESSDFDLALNEEDMVADEESASQVVALEDESDVDEGAATVARPTKAGKAAAGEEEGEDLIAAEDLEEEPAGAPVRRVAVAAAPAEWGTFVPVMLIISSIVMLWGAFMSFELLHNMWGYRQPYKVSASAIQGFGKLIPFLVDEKDLDPNK